MSTAVRGRIVGALILAAFVLYGTGSALVGADDAPKVWFGALLVLLNSVGVVVIGVVVHPVLRRTHPRTAATYVVTRSLEGVVLAGGMVFVLLNEPAAGDDAYWLAMLGLGLGSMSFCQALLQARLVPRFLAAWGIVGYAVLAVGATLELLGYGVGLTLSAPGGLFEVAVGVLLVARGFPGSGGSRDEVSGVGAHQPLLARD